MPAMPARPAVAPSVIIQQIIAGQWHEDIPYAAIFGQLAASGYNVVVDSRFPGRVDVTPNPTFILSALAEDLGDAPMYDSSPVGMHN